MTIQDLVSQKKEQLYFIELNKTLQFGDVTIEKGLDLPVDQDALKYVVAQDGEGFDMKRILRDCCMMIGIDPQFVHVPKYMALVTGLVKSPFSFCMHQGIGASEQRQWIDAIGFFQAALAFEAKNGETQEAMDAYFNLGKVHYALYLEDESVKDALKLARVFFEKAYRIEARAIVLYYLAFVSHLQERHQEALGLAKRALSGDLPEAYLQDLVTKMGTLEDKALYEKGYDLVLEERFQEGLEALLAMSDDAIDDWRVQFFIGLAYRGLLMYDESTGHLVKANALNPAEDRVLNELGIVAMLRGDFGSARGFFMDGLHLKPLNHDILCNLAILYLEANELEMAKKFADEAHTIAPEDEIVNRTRTYIGELIRGNSANGA